MEKDYLCRKNRTMSDCIENQMLDYKSILKIRTGDIIQIPIWVSITFEPIRTFPHPVSLQTIKETAALQQIGLIRQPRLAVMPLEKEDFEEIIEFSVEKIKITKS
jgi:hypothetical protein